MTALFEDVRLAPTEPGDHDRFAHYVRKAALGDAAVFGTPITAICGKKWVPSRDPYRFPVCPACKYVIDSIYGESE